RRRPRFLRRRTDELGRPSALSRTAAPHRESTTYLGEDGADARLGYAAHFRSESAKPRLGGDAGFLGRRELVELARSGTRDADDRLAWEGRHPAPLGDSGRSHDAVR